MLEGKVAIVTGTGPNIGRAIAWALARSGARVVCVHRRCEAADAVVREIVGGGGEAIAVEGDITRAEDMKRMVERAVATYGGVDVLVNNAAITSPAGLLDESLERFLDVVNVIVAGTFNCTQHVAAQMVRQRSGGAIVNIASTSGHRGKAGAVAYQAAKAAILNLTRACAVELAPHGIRVNSVTPTRTGTRVGGRPRDERNPPPGVPRGRWGTPEDVARAVVFLVCGDADFITGADLPVDGGNLATRASG
jgi:NAD(P)-dependent dehydrogenase (short-subunit alcohol dehydrogenase family)